MIQENIKLVEENIKKACEKVGRDVNEVTLIAVSKTKPYTAIEEALPTGVKDYGENKVQELCDKYEILPKDIKWHMIGHLQRNKVKYLVGKASLIHSVDSIRLAEQIEKEYAKADEIANILIEVNMAQEESKFGITSQETEELIREIAKLRFRLTASLVFSRTTPSSNVYLWVREAPLRLPPDYGQIAPPRPAAWRAPELPCIVSTPLRCLRHACRLR